MMYVWLTDVINRGGPLREAILATITAQFAPEGYEVARVAFHYDDAKYVIDSIELRAFTVP